MEWALLVERYGERVLSVARAILRDEDLSRDAAQEALMRLARAGMAPCRDLDAWVRTVAANAARDLLRRRRRTEGLKEETVDPNLQTPVEAVLARESRVRLALAMEALSGADRDVLQMKFRDNLSGPQIAGRLGISLEAAWQRLSRALKALRQQIGDSHE